MKKILLIFALILTLSAACFAFTACGDDTQSNPGDNSADDGTKPEPQPEPKPEPEKDEISFKTFEVNGTDVYGRVSKDKEIFEFTNEIKVSGKAKYVVALDALGMQTVATKTVALNPGDNIFYVIEMVDDEATEVYTVVIHRNEVYEVSFVAEDVIAVETQYIEEGFFATAPTANFTTKLGYDFVGWDFDFTKPITGDVVVKAKIEMKDEMKNCEFTSTTTTCVIAGLKDKTVTELVIPDYVTSIGYRAFWGCTSLTSVTIQNSVTSIGEDAFAFCYKLVEIIDLSSLNITKGNSSNGGVGYFSKEVHKGESKIVNYNDYLFYTYDGVNYLLGYVGEDTALVFPESYNGKNYEIYKYAFYERKDITSVTIPDSVTSIGVYTFAYCTSLTSVTIPDSVTYIGEWAFSRCDSLTSITVNEGNTAYKSIDGNLYSKDSKILIQYAIGKTDTSFVIPDSVTSIGNCAFYNCASLTSVNIPNSVTSIGSSAFYNCTGLTSVTIGNSVTSIGSYAFQYCDSLTIYCEATRNPSGWSSYWNSSDRPVVWGYKG